MMTTWRADGIGWARTVHYTMDGSPWTDKWRDMNNDPFWADPTLTLTDYASFGCLRRQIDREILEAWPWNTRSSSSVCHVAPRVLAYPEYVLVPLLLRRSNVNIENKRRHYVMYRRRLATAHPVLATHGQTNDEGDISGIPDSGGPSLNF